MFLFGSQSKKTSNRLIDFHQCLLQMLLMIQLERPIGTIFQQLHFRLNFLLIAENSTNKLVYFVCVITESCWLFFEWFVYTYNAVIRDCHCLANSKKGAIFFLKFSKVFGDWYLWYDWFGNIDEWFHDIPIPASLIKDQLLFRANGKMTLMDRIWWNRAKIQEDHVWINIRFTLAIQCLLCSSYSFDPRIK